MLTNTARPSRTLSPRAPRAAWRLAITCTATLALVAPTGGAAQARPETPEDTASGSVVAAKKVVPTRVNGLYGVKVRGGWLLR
jgi:hypothetical protein